MNLDKNLENAAILPLPLHLKQDWASYEARMQVDGGRKGCTLVTIVICVFAIFFVVPSLVLLYEICTVLTWPKYVLPKIFRAGTIQHGWN